MRRRRLEVAITGGPPTPAQVAAWDRLIARVFGPLTATPPAGNLGENVKEESA